jgi:hypothetical protein
MPLGFPFFLRVAGWAGHFPLQEDLQVSRTHGALMRSGGVAPDLLLLIQQLGFWRRAEELNSHIFIH